MALEGLSSWLQHIAGRQPYFPHQMSFILELPLRRLLVSPEQLADRLHLKQDSRVLEVGCGSGVFSVEVARRVPPGTWSSSTCSRRCWRGRGAKSKRRGWRSRGLHAG